METAKVFINGQAFSANTLANLTFDELDNVLVYQKWEDAPGTGKFPETYRIFANTAHKTTRSSQIRIKWKQYLLAQYTVRFQFLLLGWFLILTNNPD